MGMVKDQGARLRQGEGSWLEGELHEELGVARECAQSPATESMPFLLSREKLLRALWSRTGLSLRVPREHLIQPFTA